MKYSCPLCHNPDPIPDSSANCPACGREIPAPNIRLATRQDEKDALKSRLEDAERQCDLRGCRGVLSAFGSAVSKSEAVICRGLTQVVDLVSNPNSLYSTFYKDLSANRRLPEANEFDQRRASVDGRLFPNFHDEIVFAALTLNGRGPAAYGPCSIVLKEEAISHRASLFSENTYVFMAKMKISVGDDVPAGYRCEWTARADLAQAKLHSKLSTTTTEKDFPGVLIEQDTATDQVDFIEVHIFRGFSRGAVNRIVVSTPKTTEDKILLRRVKKNCAAAGIGYEEV